MVDMFTNLFSLRLIFSEMTNFQNLVLGEIWRRPKYRLGFPQMLGICLQRPPVVYIFKRLQIVFVAQKLKTFFVRFCFIVFQ